MATVFRQRKAPSANRDVVRVCIVSEDIEPSQYFRWNWVLNRLVGAVLLVLFAPVILLTMLVVAVTSPGSPLYRQKRVGKGGRVFTIYKIRSMRVDSEARTGPIWTTSSCDPRITSVGRFLRNTHLDELPQLINVVRGEMALVGPRPERPEFAEALAEEIPGYLNRLHVLPGVTGLAQVNLPPDTDLDSVRRKLVLDVKYVAKASFLLDVRIFVATVLPWVGISSGFATRVVRLDYTRDLSRMAKKEEPRAGAADSQRVELSERHIEFLDAMSFGR